MLAPHHDDPSNSAVKPSIETLEGKIALGVTALTSISAAAGVVLAAYPDNPHVKIAALVIAVLLAGLSAFVAKNHSDNRSAVKQTANLVAGSLAAIDKAREIAKDHPELAARILEGAGVAGPKSPASER